MSSDAPATKKLKPTGTPLYSDLDLSKLTFDSKVQGSNEIQHAGAKYDGVRLAFQLEDVTTGSIRTPFGIDDGSKFGGKASLKLDLPEAQRAFFQDKLENKVKDAAVQNKATWFSAIKPLPDDATVRSSFNSRIYQDGNDNYPPSLKVNVNLADDKKQKVNVLTTRRTADGKITKPVPGSPADVARSGSVVPVLRTAGGVWISVNPKKKTFDYGLVFEATDLLVVEEPAASSAFNLGGIEVVEGGETEEDGATAFDGGFGAGFGQF